jgi:hypothetical protein
MPASICADNAEEYMETKVKTGFLFADPSFISGAARVMDLWGQFDDYNLSETTKEADAKAIASDWLVVGNDIQEAIEESPLESEVTVA